MQKHFFSPMRGPNSRCVFCDYFMEHLIHKDINLFVKQRDEMLNPSFRDEQRAAMKEDREMTGRQYLFKQVGCAFASLGYIVKWYMKNHIVFPGEPGDWHSCPRRRGRECPACKWAMYFGLSSRPNLKFENGTFVSKRNDTK